jgi:hypothetical protein
LAAIRCNLPTALIPDRSGIDIVHIYDNSRSESRPALVLEVRRMAASFGLQMHFPAWLQQALGWTERDLDRHSRKLMRAPRH